MNREERLSDAVLRGLAGLRRSRAAGADSTNPANGAEDGLRVAAAVLENALEGILVTDAEGRIELVNPAFTTITGYRPEEAIGRNPRLLKSDHHAPPFYQRMWRSLVEKGEWKGQIWNRRMGGEAYLEWLAISAVRDGAGATTHYVGVFEDLTEREQERAYIRHKALHDALTGLPNRVLFGDRLSTALAHAARNRLMLGVMFIDLDRFKNVNDTLGHVLGDQLLQEVAARLKRAVRKEDTVARMGGDEFTLLVPSLAHVEDAGRLARKILDGFRAPFRLGGHEFFVSASIGVAIYPNDGESAETLLKNSDRAMYRAKEKGRNDYQLFSPEMNVKALERLLLESHLHKALDRRELVLDYQPQVDLATGGIVGVEALLRWRHPDLGLVYPSDFIPIAEDTGLIVPIGLWVLRTACAQSRAWEAAGRGRRRVAVNVSARQLRGTDLARAVRGVLGETGLDPTYLDIEITESACMENPEAAIEKLRQLKDAGLRISVDDFGTGHSSLSYLALFPIDALKVDRSFVRGLPADPAAATIVPTVITLAHALKLSVVAEGVEDEAQLAFLRDHGCDEAQGYLFGTPAPADTVEKILAGR